ncbi:MAG: hypothetical protein HOH95_07315 [Dehalococcoidia bacterium]|nr:hypothetical protein [Dehalococcoidia bacterium]
MTDVRDATDAAVRTVVSGAVRVRALLFVDQEAQDEPLFFSALRLPSLLLLGLALPQPSTA